MTSKHLSSRDKWQSLSTSSGQSAEDVFSVIMEKHLENSNIEYIYKPDSLRGIYGIHSKSGRPHGIQPEACFCNKDNGKKIYAEIKKQKAEGNAHERACKYFSPGLVKSIQKIANQPNEIFPMWMIFSGGISTHPRYQQEIKHWFGNKKNHLFLWQNLRDYKSLTNHFDTYIRNLMED